MNAIIFKPLLRIYKPLRLTADITNLSNNNVRSKLTVILFYFLPLPVLDIILLTEVWISTTTKKSTAKPT